MRCTAKWRLELVHPNCKVLCHATSTEVGGLTLWPSTGGEQISKKEMVLYGGSLGARGEIFISSSMAPNQFQILYVASIDLPFL